MSVAKFVSVSFGLGLLFSPSAGALENCVNPPSCDELGFTVNVEDCDGSSLKCPWDLSKAACRTKSADTNKPVTCAVGTILGGDQLCYEAGKLPDGISPIGIVFDEVNRLALALTDVKKDGSAGSEAMQYSTVNSSCLADCASTQLLTCGTDGRSNTNAMLTYCNGVNFAANSANIYKPKGCAEDFCLEKQWFVPSMRDLLNIYADKLVINNGLSLLTDFGAKMLTEDFYWSSTESSNFQWYLNMSNGDKDSTNKVRGIYFVRPVIKYTESW